MALKVGELYAMLGLDSKGLEEGLDQAEKKLGLTAKQMDKIRHKATMGLGVGLTALGAASFKFATDFNASMANVATLIPGNTKRVNELKGAVQSMAMETGKATTDISEGLYQVVSAFGDTADTAKVLEINVKAAAAGVATTTDAINLTSAVTKAYGDTSAEAVQHVADLAFTAVKLGQTTFPELANSIGRVTPLAKELNVTQEELFGVMATATGVTGNAAEVSTQLRGVLQSLLAPTESMNKLIQESGYESGKAMLQNLGLQGTLEAITNAAESTGTPLQQYISSIEGQTLALALAGPQADAFTEKLASLTAASGAATEAYKEQTEGVNKLGFMYDRAKQMGVVFLEKMGNVSPLITATGAIITMAAQMKQLGISMAVVRTVAASTWATVLGPIGIIIAAIAAIGVAVYVVIKYWDQIKAFFANLWRAVCNAFAAAWEWIKNLFLNYTPQGLIIKHWDSIKDFFSKLWDAVKQGISTAWEWIKNLFLNYTPQGLIIKHWEPLRDWFANLWQSIYDVTIGKLQAIVDWVKDAVGKIGDVFQGLYDRLVGHSIVPDMIGKIRQESERLEGEAMADPFRRAAKNASESLARIEELPRRGGEAGAAGGPRAAAPSPELKEIVTTARAILVELKSISREATAGAIGT